MSKLRNSSAMHARICSRHPAPAGIAFVAALPRSTSIYRATPVTTSQNHVRTASKEAFATSFKNAIGVKPT
jgi:hypothetical protein